MNHNSTTYTAPCITSVRAVTDIFGGKWALLVLEELHAGTLRFSQLQKELGVSTKSLTDTLRHLEANGIVAREAKATVPVTVEYSLTEKGRAFDDVLIAMKDWADQWIWEKGEQPPTS